MDRRTFLQTVAVGAGAAGAGSCAHLASPLSMTNAGVIELVEELKARLAAVSARPGERLAVPDPDFVRGEKLLRDGTRTLLLAGSFYSMPEDVRAHPAVQQVMTSSIGEISTTTLDMHQVALQMTAEEQRELTLRLKEDPSLIEQSAQRMDREAAALGAPLEQRASLRALFHQVGNRMKQSTPLFLGEYSRKVARISARMAEPRAFEREAIARLGEQAFSEYQTRVGTYANAWGEASKYPDTPLVAEPQTGHGDIPLNLGARLLGISAVVMGAAGLVVAYGGPNAMLGWFIMTPGVLLFVGGLISLLIGGIIRLAS